MIDHIYINQLKTRYPDIDFFIYNNIDEAKQDLKDAEVFLTLGFDTDEKLIDQAPNLKWIQCMSTGIDQMPFEKLAQRNILLTNVTGIHGIPIAEYVLWAILNHRVEGACFYEQQKNKLWKRKMNFEEVCGKTLVVIGTGTIGKEVARKAKAFDMMTIGVNTNGRKVEYFDEAYSIQQFNQSLSKGDYIVITVPLTENTRKMIGKEQLKKMKDTAYLINIARGPIVDETALYEVLKNKEIAGAA
jgi:phosphoglycerate dehydrogenase-like enzyme